MSVKKLDFNHVKQEKKSFTSNLNDVIQNINDGFILGVFIYLSSLPPTFRISRKQLQNHFDVGRDKINSTLKWLSDNYLIQYTQERLSSGKLGETGILVMEGWEFIENIVNNQIDYKNPEKHTNANFTAPLKNRTPAKPYTGKSAPINNIDNINKNNKQREALSFFEPDSKNQKLAQRLGVDIQAELDSFAKKHRGQKNQAEFEKWIKLAKEYQDKNKPYVKNEPRCTVPEYGPGHELWELRHGHGLTVKRHEYN